MMCLGSNCVSGLVKYTRKMVCAERVKTVENIIKNELQKENVNITNKP